MKLLTPRPFSALLALAGSLLLPLAPAQAGIVTASLGGNPFLMHSGDSLGSFDFTLPAGSTLTSVTLALDDFSFSSSGGLTIHLDGVEVGATAYVSDAWLSFNVSDWSMLDDGRATLSFNIRDHWAGCPCFSADGGARLVLNYDDAPTAALPEPGSLALAGLGLAVAGAWRRRR
jgi:MYXO-CTERM domain-containing protein